MTEYLRADLSHSRFEEVDFSQSRFHNVYFQDTVIRGAWLQRVEIDGYLDDAHLRAFHGKASRHRAVERFDLAVMARAYESLYDTVLGERLSRGA